MSAFLCLPVPGWYGCLGVIHSNKIINCKWREFQVGVTCRQRSSPSFFPLRTFLFTYIEFVRKSK